MEFFPLEAIRIEGGIDKGKIEETLNEYTAQGWRLRETALCGELGFICIFERKEGD